MAVRNIVKIDEEKCDGCGLCVTACAEGAIEIIDGKAKLISETYCDGLGACLGQCPQDAITIEQRQANEFDEQAVEKHLAESNAAVKKPAFVCPGLRSKQIRKKKQAGESSRGDIVSQLTHWPVQLKLISPQTPFLQGADLLLVADCVPFAMGDFHNRFLRDRAVAVGCPKLDDGEFYANKLADIFKNSKLKSLTVIHMEVPCCLGLVRIAEQAIQLAGIDLPFTDVTITLDGTIKNTEA